MPIVKVNDIEMFYESHGEGEPLVMLHGFSQSGQVWNPFIKDFGAHFRLIVADIRGHGRSTNPSGKFTHRQSALDVYALLDRLGVERFKAIGYSSGGMTLIHMATQQPDRTEAMVLVSATSHFPRQCRELQAQTNVENTTDDRWDLLQRIHLHGDGQIRMLIGQFHDMKDSYDDMNFTPPFLSTITARTLIIHGDRDEFFPVSIPTEMYASIPHSYLWIIPNAGHDLLKLPVESVHAPEIRKLTMEFLRGDWDEKVDASDDTC